MENYHDNGNFFDILINGVILEVIERIAALITGIIFGVIDPILPPA